MAAVPLLAWHKQQTKLRVHLALHILVNSALVWKELGWDKFIWYSGAEQEWICPVIPSVVLLFQKWI